MIFSYLFTLNFLCDVEWRKTAWEDKYSSSNININLQSAMSLIHTPSRRLEFNDYGAAWYSSDIYETPKRWSKTLRRKWDRSKAKKYAIATEGIHKSFKTGFKRVKRAVSQWHGAYLFTKMAYQQTQGRLNTVNLRPDYKIWQDDGTWTLGNVWNFGELITGGPRSWMFYNPQERAKAAFKRQAYRDWQALQRKKSRVRARRDIRRFLNKFQYGKKDFSKAFFKATNPNNTQASGVE